MASAARKDMEKLFGGKVFLGIWVKVRKAWTDDARVLRQLGYEYEQSNGASTTRPGYVLHTYPYKETSLIVEAFTRRTAASRCSRAARGGRARRCAACCSPSSRCGSELERLGRARHADAAPNGRAAAARSRGRGLMCGFYLNELLLRLLPREDPHESAVRRLCRSARRRSRWRRT